MKRSSRKAGHRSWSANGKPVPGFHRGDIMSVEKRSALMARIRGKNTGPEVIICEQLKQAGLDFHCHCADLPGRPDIVFSAARLAVFIDGDFWHGWRFPLWEHKLSPKWREKIAATRNRDQRNFRRLRRLGWTVSRIWEHQVEKSSEACIARLIELHEKCLGQRCNQPVT